MTIQITFLFFIIPILYSCAADPILKTPANDIFLNAPSGFKVEVFAEDIQDARAMSIGNQGTIFVGSRGAGKIYALKDTDGDFKADKTYVIDQGLKMPVGVAVNEGDLYVSAVNKILKYENIEQNLGNPPKAIIVKDDFPTETHHGWKFIDFGPDGKLYVPVGAPCNNCIEDEDRYANIMRMDKDGSNLEVFARGVRNTVGFDWHPETNVLWFTENGRDWMGDDLPPCELNQAPDTNMHFGFPYCHGTDIPDLEFGSQRDCSEFTPPAWNFDAHTAPLGMTFYRGKSFPEPYQNGAFVALHGSWNRSTKIGYEVVWVSFSSDETVSKVTPFLTGFLKSGKVYGRPVDILELQDGSILISDDKSNKIFRVSYSG